MVTLGTSKRTISLLSGRKTVSWVKWDIDLQNVADVTLGLGIFAFVPLGEEDDEHALSRSPAVTIDESRYRFTASPSRERCRCFDDGATTERRDEPTTSQTLWMARGDLDHVEIWVPDLHRSITSLGWLLETLGYEAFQSWECGRSWRRGETYIVIEESPALTEQVYDRLRPGLNHLAFQCGSREACDQLIVDSLRHGWTLLFSELHPNAGGPDHYAGYLADIDGFEVELVADDDHLGSPHL